MPQNIEISQCFVLQKAFLTVFSSLLVSHYFSVGSFLHAGSKMWKSPLIKNHKVSVTATTPPATGQPLLLEIKPNKNPTKTPQQKEKKANRQQSEPCWSQLLLPPLTSNTAAQWLSTPFPGTPKQLQVGAASNCQKLASAAIWHT